LAGINWREVASVQENDILEVKENRSMDRSFFNSSKKRA